MDRVATIISELGAEIKPGKLARISRSFKKAIVQRLGHLLDHLRYAEQAEPMLRLLREGSPPERAELEPDEVHLKTGLIQSDPRWRVAGCARQPEIQE